MDICEEALSTECSWKEYCTRTGISNLGQANCKCFFGGRGGGPGLTFWLFDFVLSTWVLESLISSHRRPLPLPLQTSSSDQLRRKQSQVFLHVWAVRRGWQKRNFQEVAAIYTGPLSGASPQVLWCLETSLMSVRSTQTISWLFLRWLLKRPDKQALRAGQVCSCLRLW